MLQVEEKLKHLDLINNEYIKKDGKNLKFKIFCQTYPFPIAPFAGLTMKVLCFFLFFKFSTIALKCGISDTVRMGSKLRKILHLNIITLMWSYKVIFQTSKWNHSISIIRGFTFFDVHSFIISYINYFNF